MSDIKRWFRKQSKRMKRLLFALLSVLLMTSGFITVGSPMGVQAAGTEPIAPGGVEGASLWLKASDDVEVDANGNVTKWIDQTTGKEFTIDSVRTGVTFNSNLANFNPTINFEGGLMIGGDDTHMIVNEIFTTVKFEEGLEGTIFSSIKGQDRQGYFRNHKNGSLVQYPGEVRYNRIQMYAPNEKGEDALKQLSSSGILDTAWENGKTENKKDMDGRFELISPHKLQLGNTNFHDRPMYGHFPELIVFDETKEFTAEERNRINSYLALKYGTTLKADDGSATDYTASDGTTKMWTVTENDGYGNRITGIGRDNASGLLQKQSKSADIDSNITIALGDTIESSNSNNASSIENNISFFTFSDNGGEADYVTPLTKDTGNDTEYLKHMDRVYKVEKTNWQDKNVTLEIDKLVNATESGQYLIVSNDEQFDSNDSFYPLVNGEVTLNSSELTNGAYFTISGMVATLEGIELDQTTENVTKIPLTFDNNLELDDLTGFTVTVDGVEVPTGDLSFEVDDARLIFTLPNSMNVTNEEIVVTYDGTGNLKGKNGVLVDDFTTSVQIPVDKSDLEDSINDSANYDEDDYTNDSWTDFQDKLDEAETVFNDPNATQDEVDTAKQNLDDAIGNLTPKPIDKTELENSINDSSNYDEDDYTNDSWTDFATALDEAETVFNDPNATQDEVDTAKQNLDDAIGNLTPKPIDKSDLEKSINDSANYDEDDYTNDSWTDFETALDEAETVFNDPNATQDEVDTAKQNLEDAINNLTPKPIDKSDLEKSINDSANYDEDDYTNDSWTDFQDKLDQAETVFNDPNATQDEVDTAKQNLEDAKKGLVNVTSEPESKVDKSELKKLIDDSANYDEDDYTDDSWTSFQRALDVAINVFNDTDAKQDNIDGALSALEKAYKGLDKKAEVSLLPKTATSLFNYLLLGLVLLTLGYVLLLNRRRLS